MSSPQTELLEAAAVNDAEQVLALLEAGEDINQADEHGLTALHYAVLRDNPELVGALLQAKAKHGARTTAMVSSIVRSDRRVFRPASGTFYLPKALEPLGPQRAFDKGATAVHLAASLGALACLEALLKGKAKATTQDGVGATPLHLAALGGHTQVVTRLLQTKTKIEAATKTRKSIRFFDVGMTPLLAALESGEAEVIDALLDAGAQLDATTKSGCTALFFVARGGCLPALAKVVAAGVPLTREPSTYNFPLLEAVEQRHEPMVARLLELGEPSETERGHQAPLRRAIEDYNLSMRGVLLDKGARPLPDHGLISAARGNDTCYIAAYIDAGSDLDMLESGATALMNASAMGHLPTVELLIERGADLNAGRDGTALHWALANTHFEIVDALLAAGADPRRIDSYGNTALHAAVGKRQPDYLGRIARILAAGANPHTASRNGATAIDMAKRMEMAELLELFEAHGSEGAVDRAWRSPEVSAVLRDAPPDYVWKKVSAALWDELVPPSGQADSVQGELVRCIGSLTDEAYRNGNMNWGTRQREMVDLLEATLLDGTFPPAREADLRGTIAKLRHYRNPDVSGNGSPHYLVTEAVVDWCLAHRSLIRR